MGLFDCKQVRPSNYRAIPTFRPCMAAAGGGGGGCVSGGGSSCPLSLKAVGNLGRGGALDDSSDYFGKGPVLWRKEWVEANLACEKK